MNTFSEAVQSTKEKYDQDTWLGLVNWFSVGNESTLNFTDLEAQLIPAFASMPDLMPRMPNIPRSVDIFKRACTSVERKKVATQDPTVFYNISLKQAGQDGDSVWRNVVREEVDTVGHELGYVTLCKVVFTRSNNSLRFEVVNESPVIDTIKTQIKAYIDTNTATVTAMTVRSFIRNYLEVQLHAIQVRESGGVYFVTRDYADALESFEGVVNNLGDVNVSCHSMVLLDDSKQREMLRVAFESESVGEVDGLIAEIQKILSEGSTLTAARYADFNQKYQDLLSKVGEYSDLIEVSMEETGLRLDIMKSLMAKALGSVKSKITNGDDQ